ncbi:MAG: hypothetical protein PF436_01895 [Prolixibacteraceae bacterium]|jgi:hypothetical protein|nr:hypothetical protein [Prolixibacteraceae bacterium]
MYSKFFVIIILAMLLGCSSAEEGKIDRKALVTRHNITVEGYDSLTSLSVGNGNFLFTTDLTGLQTFYDDYELGMPLGTQSNWGWHSNPNTENYTWDETLKYFNVEGREVPYRHQLRDTPRANAACNYFRENPHRLHLGMVGFELLKENGDLASIDDIEKAKHSLDLWTGAITSEFVFEGQPVKVEVYSHQDKDMISARVSSPLVKSGQLSIRWKFPFGVPQNTHAGYDFNAPEKHQSFLSSSSENSALISRTLDNESYQVALSWKGDASFEKADDHTFKLRPSGSETIEFSCLFAPEAEQISLDEFDVVKKTSVAEWASYWSNGGMVDFSGSTDPRAHELERRVILSQYLTKVQSSGNMPPAETGLTYNSWYGKFHLEMHWWHIAHFAQWQREHLMTEQLDFYKEIYDVALQTAQDQGYEGVRWPKMIGPSGENSPSSVGSYLVWQQPHIIWFAEQMYKQNPTPETLEKYKKLVFATAEFMADFPEWNEGKKQFDLAPPLIPAQEHWSRETTINPPFELAYWYWGLTKAQEWRERLSMDKNDEWEHVRLNLATPDKANGVYLGIEGAVNSYTDIEMMRDHPMVLGAYGILPDWDKIDPEIMRKTMHVISDRWDWPSTWGWDYPMSAMAAVRMGEPDLALEFLLKDVQKNTYLKNGHNYQSERLRVYLPGNGGLLQTMAMMCAGWEGCKIENPGFPKDGKWNVKWENISPVF